jgi:hypothetical protein
MERDEFVVGEAIDDGGEASVEEQGAVVDDDDAVAEFLDVGHVMAGEEDGGAAGGVVVAEEFADFFLRNDVEADGGFVEEEHAGPWRSEAINSIFMRSPSESSRTMTFEFGADVEQFAQFGDGALRLGDGNAVDAGIEGEGFAGGQIPPELVLFPEQRANCRR